MANLSATACTNECEQILAWWRFEQRETFIIHTSLNLSRKLILVSYSHLSLGILGQSLLLEADFAHHLLMNSRTVIGFHSLP